jgi:transcriptional regulator with XRE-family HTH domain
MIIEKGSIGYKLKLNLGLTACLLLVKEMLAARARLGLSQEAVAECELMGTTKSAISRLEAAGKHAPSMTTLRKYARAVGCHLEIKFVAEHA